MLFNGKQWLLTDSNTAESTPVVLRSNCLSNVVTFEYAKGSALAKLTNGLFRSGSSFCWGSETYRWSSGPDKLMLINVNTDEVHAILSSRFTVYPWSRNQGRLILFGNNHDSIWMRVVIGGALAEATSKKSCPKYCNTHS